MDNFIKKDLYSKILQYLFNKIPFSYPIPKNWQHILDTHSIEVNKKKSTIIFYLYVFTSYFRFMLMGIKLILSFPSINRNIKSNTKKVQFIGLTYNNLPSTNIPENNFDLITWYILKTSGGNLTIFHDVDKSISLNEYLKCNISYNIAPFKNMYGILNRLKFIKWLIPALIISIKDLFFGKWHHAIILGEAIKAKAVFLNNNLADIYLFHFSSQSYRPMWTYQLQSRNIETICYFYSTFEQPNINHSNQLFTNSHEFYLYNWPNSYFWDSFQYKMVQNSCKFFVNGEIKGPIWFTDNKEIAKKYEKPYVVVFDIQQHRKFYHFGTSTLTEYFEYDNDLHYRFLNDVLQCCNELGILILHKAKRDIGKRSGKNYRSMLRDFKKNTCYINVSPDISPIKLIDNSIAVISMPFTSTALYGSSRNKPSIYYDPVCWIEKNDEAAHGIPIILGKEMLKNWLINCLMDENKPIYSY
jgi:polysaccharide biosynthesis PFTS motif protein